MSWRRFVFFALAALGSGCTRGDDLRVDDSGEDSGENVAVAGVTFGEIRACEAPLPSVSWTEVGAAMGMRPSPEVNTIHTAGGTLAVDDFTGDGRLDVSMTYSGSTFFYLSEGSSPSAGAPFAFAEVAAPPSPYLTTIADLNEPGVGRRVILGGSGIIAYTIVDGAITQRNLIEDPRSASASGAQGAYPADIDGDGDTDFFALRTEMERPDFVLWGEGDGWFTADPAAIPAELPNGMGFDATWFDWDRDGDVDLYIVNDKGPEFGGNVLLENVDGALIDASDRCACDLSISGMGVDAADYNRDGLADLFITVSGGTALLTGGEDGVFTDTTVVSGLDQLDSAEMGWGGVWLDFDNDGALDLIEALGDLWADPVADAGRIAPMSSHLYHQEGDGTFVDVAASYGLDRPGSWRSVVAADFNADGVLDPILGDVVGTPMFWLSDGCTSNAWIEVRGPEYAEVTVRAGGVEQVGWISARSGMAGSKPLSAHFGLGVSTLVDSLTVRLLDGTSYTVSEPFPARRTVTVGDVTR